MQSVPLTLFLELEEGRSVSLESAAHIALAWNDLIVEIFSIIDPSIDVRVELLDAVESSLGLRSIVRAVGRVPKKHPVLAGIIGGILATFFNKPVDDLADWCWDKVYEAVGGALNPDPDSPERKKIAEQVEVALRDNVAAKQKADLFICLEREPVITAARASPSHTWKPPLVVPRSEFATRAGVTVLHHDVMDRRTIRKRMSAVLLTAKLEPKELTWRFADENGEPFSAKMKDIDFINRLNAKHTGLELRIGFDMEIEIEAKQELVGGVWVNRERAVTKVLRPSLPPVRGSQLELLIQ